MSGVDNDIAARFAGKSEIFTDEAIFSSEHSILNNKQELTMILFLIVNSKFENVFKGKSLFSYSV